MQRTRRRYRLLTATLMLLAASAAAAPQGEYYGSGYTIISQEHGNDDLQATVYRQLTPGTVGQALPQLLDGTGWRLADSHAADDRIYRLYNQPLPEHKLRIGPMPLDQALGWIAGDGWALVVDPVNRLVSFEVEARYDSRPPVGIHSRPAATSHAPDVAPAATPVYADLPPQGSFPAVQTAPDYSATTYRTPTAAYPAPVREDWQSTLPQRLADNAHAPQPPREQRRSKTRKALRPAVTATGNDSAAAAVPQQTAASNRHAVATTQKTATTAAAPATKTTPAKTGATAADKVTNEQQRAAKGAALGSRPATAQHPATPDKAAKKAAAPTENKRATKLPRPRPQQQKKRLHQPGTKRRRKPTRRTAPPRQSLPQTPRQNRYPQQRSPLHPQRPRPPRQKAKHLHPCWPTRQKRTVRHQLPPNLPRRRTPQRRQNLLPHLKTRPPPRSKPATCQARRRH